MKSPALFLAAAIFLAVRADAGILRIPDDHPTIGGGLAAAGSGDTVLVAAGVYEENLIWPAVPGIVLLGEGGAEETIIDGRGMGSVVEIATGVDTTTVIRGFTLRNGRAFGG